MNYLNDDPMGIHHLILAYVAGFALLGGYAVSLWMEARTAARHSHNGVGGES
jgi:hypothetical protein